MDKDVYGYISLALTVVAYLPYVWSTWKGNTKPHVVGWIIWSLPQLIASAGQYSSHAGPGSWSTAASGLFCVLIALMSFRYGEKTITRHDIIIFVATLAALPLWYFTSNPLSAILLVTLIDVLGYLPTMRKAWHKPGEEMWIHYAISNFKHIFAICAMTAYSVTTILYPLALFFMNCVLIALIFRRKRALSLS